MKRKLLAFTAALLAMMTVSGCSCAKLLVSNDIVREIAGDEIADENAAEIDAMNEEIKDQIGEVVDQGLDKLKSAVQDWWAEQDLPEGMPDLLKDSDIAADVDYGVKMASFLSDARFKHGAPWGTDAGPQESKANAESCCAYCCDFVAVCFGHKNGYADGAVRFSDPNEIRAGDVIHVNPGEDRGQHWFVVLFRYGDKLATAEGNWTNEAVYVSMGEYYNKDGMLCRGGHVPFRTWDCGYHHK